LLLIFARTLVVAHFLYSNTKGVHSYQEFKISRTQSSTKTQ